MLRSLKIFSHTSFNIIESSKRVGGDEIFVVWIGEQSWLEDEGKSVELISLTTIWFICSELLEEVDSLSHMIESSSSEYDSIIIVLEGAATFRGCTTNV